jgi:hypothetical protein
MSVDSVDESKILARPASTPCPELIRENDHGT